MITRSWSPRSLYLLYPRGGVLVIQEMSLILGLSLALDLLYLRPALFLVGFKSIYLEMVSRDAPATWDAWALPARGIARPRLMVPWPRWDLPRPSRLLPQQSSTPNILGCP